MVAMEVLEVMVELQEIQFQVVRLLQVEQAEQVEQAPSGLSQKEQQARLRQFRSGLANILICTSIGEEGLDIPEMHLAIFYETVPSAIRAIQRRGRVGRTQVGRVVVLYTRGTRDEAYHWASQRREKEMHATLHRIRNQSRL